MKNGFQDLETAIFIMSLTIKERLHRFFLGDNSAWEEIFNEFYNPMVDKFTRRFSNLSFAEVEDVIDEWFTEMFSKIDAERNRAEIEGKLKNLSAKEIADKKIEYCAEKFGYEFEGSFKSWLWVVLNRKLIDYLRKKNRRNESDIDNENPGDKWNGMSDVELRILMKEFNKILSSVLSEKEKLYFQIWNRYGWNPDGKIVREIFKKHFGEDYSNSSITIFKQRFIRLCYLTFIRIEYDAARLKETFRHFMGKNESEHTFFDDMMHIIWNVFYEDSETREKSRQKISRNLWEDWEDSKQKKSKQKKILVAAFRHFRTEKPRPGFCHVINLYADDTFGGEVRRLFFEE
jgi:DNA-directed RNA polymerase specialized sigma24 family protein